MSTTSASTSRGRRHRRKPQALDPLRLIRITDRHTGTLLFERIYEWPEHANPSNLGSLVQSFFQFAREVDGGEVESIYFEEGAAGFLPSATPRSIGSSEPRALSLQSDSMKLINARSDEVMAVLFHECPGPEHGGDEVFAQMLNSVVNEFSNGYRTVLTDMRGSFAGLNDSDPGYHSKLDEIQSVFDGFSEAIDKLRFRYLKPVIRTDISFKSISHDENDASGTSFSL